MSECKFAVGDEVRIRLIDASDPEKKDLDGKRSFIKRVESGSRIWKYELEIDDTWLWCEAELEFVSAHVIDDPITKLNALLEE